MLHAMGDWGWGRGGEVRTLLFSPVSTSQPELGQKSSDFSSFLSPPFPKCAMVPIPRPLPGLKIGIVKQQTHTKTGFPCMVKRVIFIVSFLAYSGDVLLIASLLEQCWPPCIHLYTNLHYWSFTSLHWLQQKIK